MATTEERVRLILDLVGRGDIKGATSEFQAFRKEIELTSRAMGDHDSQSGKIGKGNSRAAQGFQEVARAAEDLQYGIGGVVNNIPGIVSLFTGSAGLAAGASIAAVAINQLYKNWNQLVGSMSGELNVDSKAKERRANLVKALFGIEDASGAGLQAAVREAVAKQGGGAGFVDELTNAMLDAAGGGSEETKQKLRQQFAELAAEAIGGDPEAIRSLVNKAAGLGKADIAGTLIDALIGSNETGLAEKASQSMAKIFGAINQGFQQFGGAGMTKGQAGAASGGFLKGMTSAGVSPEVQEAVSRALSGGTDKLGNPILNQRLIAAMPQIVEILTAVGATEREIFEAIPKIAEKMRSGKGKRGKHPLQAAQEIANELARGGLSQFNNAADTSQAGQAFMEGAAFLGLTPGINDATASRFQRRRNPGGGLAKSQAEKDKEEAVREAARREAARAKELAGQGQAESQRFGGLTNRRPEQMENDQRAADRSAEESDVLNTEAMAKKIVDDAMKSADSKQRTGLWMRERANMMELGENPQAQAARQMAENQMALAEEQRKQAREWNVVYEQAREAANKIREYKGQQNSIRP